MKSTDIDFWTAPNTDNELRVKIMNTAFDYREDDDGESYGYYRGQGPQEQWVEVDTDFVEAMANDLLALIHSREQALLDILTDTDRSLATLQDALTDNNHPNTAGIVSDIRTVQRTALATIRGEK